MNKKLSLFLSPKSCPRKMTARGYPCRIRLGAVGLQPGFSKQGKIGGIQPPFRLTGRWLYFPV